MYDTFGIVPAPGERERHAWIPQAVESLAYSGHPGRSKFRDRLERAGVVQAFVQPPRARSGPEAAGARDCMNDCSHPSSPHGAIRDPRKYCRVRPPSGPRFGASLPREMEKRPCRQADDAADDRWANIRPAWRQSV